MLVRAFDCIRRGGVPAVAGALVLAGCTTQDLKKYGIPIGTATLAGIGCNQLFDGKNRAMATAICAGGGAWLGTKLRDYLNEREKAQLAESTYKTLDTGQAQTIKTDTGATITTERVKTAQTVAPAPGRTSPSRTEQAPAPSAPSSSSSTVAGADCGSVKQTVVTSDNRRYEDTVNACKKGGTWVVT